MARSLHKKSAAKSAKAAKKAGKTVGAAKSAGAAKQGDALVEKLRRYIRLHGDMSLRAPPAARYLLVDVMQTKFFVGVPCRFVADPRDVT